MKLVNVAVVLALAICAATIFFLATKPSARFDLPFILSIATVTKSDIKYLVPRYKKLTPLSDILQQYQQKFQSDGKYAKFYTGNMPDPDMLAIIDYRIEDTGLIRICVVGFYLNQVTVPALINGDHNRGIRIDTWKKNAKWELVDSR